MKRRKARRSRGRRGERGSAFVPVLLIGGGIAAAALLLPKKAAAAPPLPAMDLLLARTKPGETGAALELDDALKAASVRHQMTKHVDGGVMFFVAEPDVPAADAVLATIKAKYAGSWLTA